MAELEAEAMTEADEAADSLRPAGARRNIWPWVLLGVLASFTLGLLGSPWLETNVRSHLPQPAIPGAATRAEPNLDALERRLRRLEAAQSAGAAPAGTEPGANPDLAARLEALEARIATQREAEAGFLVSLQQLAADLQQARQAIDAGDAQVRDLFLLSLVRRMVVAGRPLDPVLPLLLDRFRTRDAAAIETLAAWSHEPQTRETLGSRLPGLEAAGAGASGGWWQRLKAGVGGLVRVHDPSAPDRLSAADGLAAAETALRRNDLGLAIRHVEELPSSSVTRQWMHDARLLADAEMALERLDALALSAAIAAVGRAPAATAGG